MVMVGDVAANVGISCLSIPRFYYTCRFAFGKNDQIDILKFLFLFSLYKRAKYIRFQTNEEKNKNGWWPNGPNG